MIQIWAQCNQQACGCINFEFFKLVFENFSSRNALKAHIDSVYLIKEVTLMQNISEKFPIPNNKKELENDITY